MNGADKTTSCDFCCYIARNAFSYDSHMKKVIIPDSVEYIYNSAFMDSKVESVHVGANVSKICDSAFSSCVNLVDIILPEALYVPHPVPK